jgi:hypothetical protein
MDCRAGLQEEGTRTPGLLMNSAHAHLGSPSADPLLIRAERVDAFKGTRRAEAGTTNAKAIAKKCDGGFHDEVNGGLGGSPGLVSKRASSLSSAQFILKKRSHGSEKLSFQIAHAKRHSTLRSAAVLWPLEVPVQDSGCSTTAPGKSDTAPGEMQMRLRPTDAEKESLRCGALAQRKGCETRVGGARSLHTSG